MANAHLDKKAQEILDEVRDRLGVDSLSRSQAVHWLGERVGIAKQLRAGKRGT